MMVPERSQRDIAILGGSFNPPHIGHIFMTQYVLATADVEQVWLLPCYRHAFGKRLAPFEHRLALCRLAVSSFHSSVVKVLPLERERRGTSWTIETVRYLLREFPDMHFTWIIGSDVLHELKKWKNFDQLLDLISFVVVPRAGAQPLRTSEHFEDSTAFASKQEQTLQQLQAQCQELERQGLCLPDVSSSQIRDRLKHGLSIQHLVPRSVKDYIEEHALYTHD